DDLAAVPRPLQRPHPPIRVGVHTPESFAHIGDLGLPIYSVPPPTPLPLLRECMTHSRARLAAAGHPWGPEQMALMFPLHVAGGGAAAREAMRPGVPQDSPHRQAIFSPTHQAV